MHNHLYENCRLCPRACGTDRSAGTTGYCGETSVIRAACACLHFGEEPPITGAGGSGAVFFSGCTLQCDFCQNWQVSRCGEGAALTEDELARIFLRLQQEGAGNINVVTGTHFAPGILASLARARSQGLSIPMVWNSSGYETAETIAMLAGSVTFFLPDLKTLSPGLARERFRAADYPDRAKEALPAMAEAKPLEWSGETPVQGVIVRHLVLPGHLEETREALAWFASRLSGRALLSLMFQYTPIPGQPLAAPLDRMTSVEEHAAALAMLGELGIDDGYFQEPVPDTGWLPDFTRPRPFSSGLSRMVWHYRDGTPRW
jgi:putative pyruvate formate lyase activating enzyme